ncbi:unnamed protein product [Sphacelaria rigidula]
MCIKQKREIALRQPLWVRVEKSPLKPRELVKLDALKETGDDDFYAEVYDCTIDGEACIEFHVDLLSDNGVIETFDALRDALGPNDGQYSVRFEAAAGACCKAHHSEEVCKCRRKVHYFGQDESIYKAYAREGNEWVIQGVRGLRKKTEGSGELISAFQDERRGFGLPVLEDELQRVDQFRHERGRPALKRTPGTRHLVFGESKGGYWDFDRFERQIVDVMDVLEVIEENKQIVFEVDHSAGHAKMREDGLRTSFMSVKYGGKQRVLKDMKIKEGCLGESEATMYKLGEKWSTKSSPGARPHRTRGSSP